MEALSPAKAGPMRLDDERESSNIEDQRGEGGGMGLGGLGGGGGGGGMGGILGLIFAARGLGIGLPAIIILALGYFFFFGGGGGHSSAPTAPDSSSVGFQNPAPGRAAPGGAQGENKTDVFVRKVLATTEDTWGQIFKANGQTYTQPKLVFYSGEGRSGCGAAQSAMGPFYCPNDHKVYLDTAFFDELSRRFGAPGDFAAAYVIAHEIGHHVQTLTGQMTRAQRSGLSQEGAGGAQVRIELQADCYAGVWGNANKAILDPGDVDQALRAATAIGDDTLQREAGRRVSPDSFTHGTSAQRSHWFKAGYDSGDPGACDTFGAGTL